MGFDRVDRHVEVGSDLLVAEPIEVSQVENGPAALRQFPEGAMDLIEDLCLYKPFHDGFFQGGALLVRLVAVGYFFVFVEIAAAVLDHQVEKGFDGPKTVKSLSPVPQLDKGILYDVLRFLQGPGEVPCKKAKRLVKQSEQMLKGLLVPVVKTGYAVLLFQGR